MDEAAGAGTPPTTLGRATTVGACADAVKRPAAGPTARAVASLALALAVIGAPGPASAQGADGDEGEGGGEAPGAGTPRGTTIPRAALVDMTRAQSRVICTSAPFLGCMGFDSDECLALSESAIERCLMKLPAEIDPTTLDNAALEACPRELYERAGYTEEKARACFDAAVQAAEAEEGGSDAGGADTGEAPEREPGEGGTDAADGSEPAE